MKPSRLQTYGARMGFSLGTLGLAGLMSTLTLPMQLGLYVIAGGTASIMAGAITVAAVTMWRWNDETKANNGQEPVCAECGHVRYWQRKVPAWCAARGLACGDLLGLV